MKKYEAYKNSDIVWIGDIPEHWKAMRLKYLVAVPLKYGANEAAEEENTEHPRYIRITDFGNDGNLRDDTFKSLPPEKAEEYLLNEGDLLFARSGATVGKTFQFKNYKGKACFAGYLIKASFNSKEVISDFINYYTKSSYYENWKQSIFQQATIQNIGADKYNQFIIALPPSPKEQITIAGYLDHKTTQLESLISKKEKLIELLHQERTAIINHAVTKGIHSNVPMKDSGIEWLGEIPEHWELKKIKHVTKKIGSGVTPKGGGEVYQDSGIPLLRSQNVYFDGFRLDDVAYISEEIHKSMSGSKVYPSDILLNITGGSIGRCYYVTDEFQEANVNQHVCIVRPNSQIETIYLYNLLRSRLGQLQIDICQSGGNRESLNFEQLKNFSIPLPSIDEQREILWFIEKREAEINTIISKTQQEIELLKEYKIALISEVVTGKVDVRNEILN